jgi:xanthine dehydrogenase accessory factor
MLDVLETIEKLRAQNEALALATVVGVYGSSPRPLGAKMVVGAQGELAGSVSGGCVESSVIEIAQQVIASGVPQLIHFGISDETAWNVGLMCGGEIDVFIQKLDAQFDQIAELIHREQMFTLQTVIRGESIGRLTLAPAAAPQPARQTDTQFIETISPAPVLYIVGASHIAIALVSIAKLLGYRVVVIDPRGAFATPERFAHADALWVDYPQHVLTPAMLHANTCVAVLTHDAKVDDPALIVALQSKTRYIGALGSRRTHAKRIERLKKAGLSDEQIARIRAPIGLDIGARTAEEIALAVAAQIVYDQRSTLQFTAT